MKRLFSIFSAVTMVFFIFSSNVQAMNMEKFLTNTQNIQKEYLELKNQVDMRDFEFFLQMSNIFISIFNTEVGNVKSKGNVSELVEVVKKHCLILGSHYISMKQYLKRCVIAKSQNTEQTKSKCSKILHYIEEAIHSFDEVL